MSLMQKIEKFQQEMLGQIPEDIMLLFTKKTEDLIKSGLAEKALKKGAKIPEFSLLDLNGKSVNHARLIEKAPLVINFYRGGW